MMKYVIYHDHFEVVFAVDRNSNFVLSFQYYSCSIQYTYINPSYRDTTVLSFHVVQA